jgi:hypothetical protein
MELWFKVQVKQKGQDVTHLKILTLANGIKRTKTNNIYFQKLEGKEKFHKFIGSSRNLPKFAYFKKCSKE